MKTPTQKHYFGNDSSLSHQNTGWSIPTYGSTDKTYQQQYCRIAREKYTALTIHPHHCSKILFQNEDSHSKKFRVIIIIKIPVGQSQPTVRQSVSAAVGTLETKRKFRRFILITAVKFYSKMKTPTQKNLG